MSAAKRRPTRESTAALGADGTSVPLPAGVEACLAAAGLAATRNGAQSGAFELTVVLGSGERPRILVFVTEGAAAAHARNVERLVRAAGRRDATVIARRRTVVGTWPAAIPRGDARRLRRCL